MNLVSMCALYQKAIINESNFYTPFLFIYLGNHFQGLDKTNFLIMILDGKIPKDKPNERAPSRGALEFLHRVQLPFRQQRFAKFLQFLHL